MFPKMRSIPPPDGRGPDGPGHAGHGPHHRPGPERVAGLFDSDDGGGLADPADPADPASPVRSSRVYFIECCTCGYEPADQDSLPRFRCPKCFCGTWHRVLRPHMLVREPAA